MNRRNALTRGLGALALLGSPGLRAAAGPAGEQGGAAPAPRVPKRYLQTLISDGVLESEYGIDLDPERTDVFLCGNPSMIGLPEEVDGQLRYPETTGVVELLVQRGFTLDHRKERGNVHFEEYW